MHVEIHDGKDRVYPEELTSGGLEEAIFQCKQMIEELRAALDEESEEEDDEEAA